MKGAIFVAAAIAVGLPAVAASTAFGATSSTPRHHHERLRYNLHAVPAIPRGEANRRMSPERREQQTAGRQSIDPKFAGMSANLSPRPRPPSAEWDCGNGDAGCSWEPSGWSGPKN